jgi:hypothetical protein
MRTPYAAAVIGPSALLAGLAAAGVAVAASSSAAGTTPARALVFAKEYRLTASRETVPAGRVVMQLRNIGEDDHDLVVRRLGGAILATTGIVGPGRLGQLTVRLTPGRYVLFCSVADHEQRGMRRVLQAKRKP